MTPYILVIKNFMTPTYFSFQKIMTPSIFVPPSEENASPFISCLNYHLQVLYFYIRKILSFPNSFDHVEKFKKNIELFLHTFLFSTL